MYFIGSDVSKLHMKTTTIIIERWTGVTLLHCYDTPALQDGDGNFCK